MGRAMIQLIGVFAQLERDLHAEATRDRLHALRNMGMTLGRPRGAKDLKKRSRRWRKKPPL
jgi:DNA invertase Pin-like site-specific DNA recombinase